MATHSSIHTPWGIADAARAEHEALAIDVADRVESEVANAARPPLPGEERRAEALARDMRARAVEDLGAAEREARRGRAAARVAQITDYLFGLVYALLAMRFALALLAARSSAGFVRFVVGLTDPLYAPFRGIVSSPRIHGGHTVLVPIVVAIVAYAILHLAIRGLLRLFAERRATV